MSLEDKVYFLEEKREGQEWKRTHKIPPMNDEQRIRQGLRLVQRTYGYKHEYRIGIYERTGQID